MALSSERIMYGTNPACRIASSKPVDRRARGPFEDSAAVSAGGGRCLLESPVVDAEPPDDRGAFERLTSRGNDGLNLEAPVGGDRDISRAAGSRWTARVRGARRR